MDLASKKLRLLTVMALIVLSSSKLTASQNEGAVRSPIRNDRIDLLRLRTSSETKGTWSPWGGWSSCSRTCGGGVAVQSRNCLPNSPQNEIGPRGDRRRRRLPSGSEPQKPPEQHLDSIAEKQKTSSITISNGRQPHCEGMDKRYHECNTLSCPGPVRDFRAEQCSAFDRRPFRGRYFTWVPYIDSKNPCTLNCRPSGKSFYATLASAVDGTACSKPGFRALCVQGQCKAVGFDGVVAQWSGAGAGPGTGSYRCGPRLVSGLFTRSQLPLGYTHVATLPPGACRINITEMHHSNNFLALKTTNGSFIINGNFAISWSGEYEAAGTKFLYKQGGNVESISAPGPLLQSVDVMILYQHPNPGIKYEYTIQIPPGESEIQKPIQNPVPAPPLLIAPRINNSLPYMPRSLVHHQYSHRSRLEPEEVSNKQQDPTPPKENIPDPEGNSLEPRRSENEKYPYGTGVLATESERPNQPVHPRHKRRRFGWKPVGYTACSKQCAGMQTRQFGCFRELNQTPVPEKKCGTKPPSYVRPCGNRCAPRWSVGAWSPCSASCGPSSQSRQIICLQDITYQNLNVKVADSLCPENPPPPTQKCQLPDCPNDRIEIKLKSNEGSQWRNELGVDYGYNRNEDKRSRFYKNKNDTDRFTDESGRSILYRYGNETIGKSDDELSNEITENNINRNRNSANWKPENAWMYSEWSQECSEECGKGLQTRMVKCADPSGCDERKKPAESRTCSSDRKCNTQASKWFTGPWSQCSNPCAINGKMTREVICISYYKGQHRVTTGCPQHLKPDAERPCPPSMMRSDCTPEWFISEWSQCIGPCGATAQTRFVTCQSSSAGPEGSCALPRPVDQRDCVPSHCHMVGFTPRAELRSGNEDNTINNPISNGQCVDKIPTCHIAVQARLCQYEYYKSSCCAACRKAPNIS